MRMLARLSRSIAAFPRARGGVSAVEFAMIAPVFVLILAGVADIGSVLHAKFRLNGAVSSGANYAIVNGEQANADDGEILARSLLSILADTPYGRSGRSYVHVNGGVYMSLAAGVASIGGDKDEAANCYCPASSGSGIDWGQPMTCQAPCSAGGLAGKYVLMSVEVDHSPLFGGGYGLLENGKVSARAVVQVQ